MSKFSMITNPKTGNNVKITSPTGKSVLKSYLEVAQKGGASYEGAINVEAMSPRALRAVKRDRNKKKARKASEKQVAKKGLKIGSPRKARQIDRIFNKESERPSNENDLKLYGYEGSSDDTVFNPHKSGENAQASITHRHRSKLYGKAVSTQVSSMTNKTGFHFPEKHVWSPDESAPNKEWETLQNFYYGAQPTSLVNINVVKAALLTVPDRVATRSGQRRITMPKDSSGKVISWQTEIKKGELMDHNYPVSLNAHMMANFLQHRTKNNTDEAISFHSLNIASSFVPPSHMVSVDDMVQTVMNKEWETSGIVGFSENGEKLYNDSKLIKILAGIVGLTPDEAQDIEKAKQSKTKHTKKLWNKMLRNGDGTGLLDYHGLKLNFRGMLFDFIMTNNSINFSIDKNDNAISNIVPRSKCMITPNGYLQGKIKYNMSEDGKSIELTSVELQKDVDDCWPPKKVAIY